MRKIIKQGTDARQELAKGAKFLSDSVKGTIGPFGYNWFIDKKNDITNDGVTVAREITLTDEVQQRGVVAIREAALKTVDQVGDGTSTSILLGYEIYTILAKDLSKENVLGARKPSELTSKVKKECEEVIALLKDMAVPISTKEQLIDSATVSTEDKELGTLIGEAQWDLGPNGFLLAEVTAERSSSVEKVKGIRIDNGFGTSQLINNQEKGTLEIEDASILLTSLTMREPKDFNTLVEKILEPARKSGIRNVVVVARAWTDDTVKLCMANIQSGALNVFPLSAPYTNMTERMKDLAAVTGATFYDSENSNFDDMMLSGLGEVKKVVARRMEAILTGKDDDTGRVDKRVSELMKELDGEVSEFAKKSLQERISQLTNGFAVVKVGSASEMNQRRLFDKADDAVNAVRAAFQEGTVPGAGLAFKEISDSLPDTYLLKRPLLSLYQQIMSSAPDGFVIEPWVRDPVKVLRIALEQACAAASVFATAGGVITVENSKPLDELLRRNTPTQE